MPTDECFEAAFRSADPFEQLRSLALRLSTQGHDGAAILERFEKVRQQLREEGRDGDEDVVMDVMDCVVGWCSPHMRLPRTQTAEDRGSIP